MTGQQSPLEVSTGAGWWKQPWQVWGVCLGLAVLTFAVFGQTLTHPFLDVDDNDYVYANPIVTQGLSGQGFVRAFSRFHADNWHPLTWLSHELDCQLYGLNPAGHHLTNVLLHAATAIALFLVLRRMTGALWRSAFVAAVFAVHPLRVESVAWVAERKDLLSGLFFMLTLGAYVRYARDPRPGLYSLVLLLFTLGLMCKPMLVTLPLVLLLLDYWPLQRKESAGKLVLEKLSLLALSAASCVVTLLAQKIPMEFGSVISFPERLRNALVSCAVYLGQMVWPAGLAVLYPFPRDGTPGWEVALAGALLAMVSAVAWKQRRRRSWLLVGWLWYLVMLFPVLGIIQVGFQAHADRYTYLPQIGIYMAVTWTLGDLLGFSPNPNRHLDPDLARLPGPASRARLRVAAGVGAGVVGLLMVTAAHQTAYWCDSETLYRQALACTKDNDVMHDYLGTTLLGEGSIEAAVLQFQKALQIRPGNVKARCNLGIALCQEGKPAEGISQLQQTLQYQPAYLAAQINLAWLLATCPEASLRHARKAVELAQQANEQTGGSDAFCLRTLAAAYAEAGRFSDAVKTARLASGLAAAQGLPGLAAQIQSELDIYRARKAFPLPGPPAYPRALSKDPP